MAATVLRYDLTWENDVGVKLQYREDAGDPITIFEMEENGSIANCWDDIASIMTTVFAEGVKQAGDAMKS